MRLPEPFRERMKSLLGEEYNAFEHSFDEKPYYGLRVNTLKISVEEFLKKSPFELKPIPWVPEGFYFDESDRPSKHPFYHAGLYYIQEPSAMSPVALLEPQPGETILDTCAAPGGKSCQIAARLQGTGLLLTNDVSATRAKALLHNIEISGIKNAIVLCEDPSKLVGRLSEAFDRILVDAPCSGEGMFRKSEGAVKAWDSFKAEACCDMQEPILEAAHQLLAPGGTLVYSTCTFNRMENEDMIYGFMDRHPEYSQSPSPISGPVPGFPGENGQPAASLYRIWPHKAEGEGHFLSRIHKGGEPGPARPVVHHQGTPPESFQEFCRQYLSEWEETGTYLQIGDRLLLVPEHRLDLKGLRIIRGGWYLGDLKKDRFEPSQAFAMGLRAEQFNQVIDFDASDPEVVRYLKGETLHVEASKGWNLITVEGFPLGWGKGNNGMLKNHYPASWRRID